MNSLSFLRLRLSKMKFREDDENTQEDASPKHSRFLGLPAEIRLTMYELVICAEPIAIPWRKPVKNFPINLALEPAPGSPLIQDPVTIELLKEHGIRLAIFHVNRQIRAEAWMIFFKKNTFLFLPESKNEHHGDLRDPYSRIMISCVTLEIIVGTYNI